MKYNRIQEISNFINLQYSCQRAIFCLSDHSIGSQYSLSDKGPKCKPKVKVEFEKRNGTSK